MSFKQLVKDYFTFSRNERKGITILLILIFLLGIANKLVFYFEKPARIDFNLLDSASIKLGEYSDSINQTKTQTRLFRFNPNTIDSVTLESLDLPVNVKSNLLKFRNRKGKFHVVSDFKKIYGVTDSVYGKVESYLFLDVEPDRQRAIADKQELFQFDPNKASDQDFLSLGFSEKQISTIRNFQKKGGSFHSQDDFFKIYGITDHQKSILSDYILIEDQPKNVVKKTEFVNEVRIELNSADSVTLEQLPGIGEKLSKRIVKYRELLGGFYKTDQLSEVYGLNEQTIQKIGSKLTIDTTKIRKIDLNFADQKGLSRHPYIQKNLAEKIIKFRTSHGSISDLSVLLDNMILNIDEYKRLRPYF
jgi:competence ComEA-like helix-hairpin-helix protein